MTKREVEEGKTMAIIAYIWWIGTLIAFVKNMNKHNSYVAFHIRQMMGLLFFHLIAGIVVKYISEGIGFFMFLGTFILWLIGIFGALKNEPKQVPYFGDKFQDWFKGIS